MADSKNDLWKAINTLRGEHSHTVTRIAVLETQRADDVKIMDQNTASIRNIQRTTYPVLVGLGGLILNQILNLVVS